MESQEEVKEELALFEAFQLLALKSYLDPDENTFYRRVCRWFATTFHTSLFEVEKRPFEEILQHYLEYNLEQMSRADFEKHKNFLLYKEAVLDADQDDEDFAEALELEFIRKNQAALNEKNNKEKSPLPAQMPPDIKLDF